MRMLGEPTNTAIRSSYLVRPFYFFEHGAGTRFPALLFQCAIAFSQIGPKFSFKLLEFSDFRRNAV